MTLQHKFIENIPRDLEDNTIYISLEYCTAIHKCVCGCGNEVVTPISPTGWKLTFDVETISLSPSIGSWKLKCRSHYFITNNKIVIARNWDDEEIVESKRLPKTKSKRRRFFNFKKK